MGGKNSSQQPAPYNASAQPFGFGGNSSGMGAMASYAGLPGQNSSSQQEGGHPFSGMGGGFSGGPPTPYGFNSGGQQGGSLGQVLGPGSFGNYNASTPNYSGGQPRGSLQPTGYTPNGFNIANGQEVPVYDVNGKQIGTRTTGGSMPGGDPNFQGSAEAQAASAAYNLNQQTMANRPNSTNAFGSSQQWSIGPDGTWQLSQGFGGPLGQTAQNLQQQALQNSNTPLDNGSQARDQAINAAYGQATSRLNPQFAQREDSLNAQLANQGLAPGSQAYRTAQQQFGQQRNDAYNQAMYGAIGQGTAAQQATFNENLMARQYPMQALQGMQGFLQNPQFNLAGQSAATNYMDAAQSLANWQQGQASNTEQTVGDIAKGAVGLGKGLIGL